MLPYASLLWGQAFGWVRSNAWIWLFSSQESNCGVFRRGKIQAHHLRPTRFSKTLLVVADFEGLDQVRLKTVGPPHAVDHGRTTSLQVRPPADAECSNGGGVPAGFLWVVHSTIVAAQGIAGAVGLRPPRGASFSMPARPSLFREAASATCPPKVDPFRVLRQSWCDCPCLRRPPVRSGNAIHFRRAGILSPARDHRSKVWRSSCVNVILGATRMALSSSQRIRHAMSL